MQLCEQVTFIGCTPTSGGKPNWDKRTHISPCDSHLNQMHIKTTLASWSNNSFGVHTQHEYTVYKLCISYVGTGASEKISSKSNKKPSRCTNER